VVYRLELKIATQPTTVIATDIVKTYQQIATADYRSSLLKSMNREQRCTTGWSNDSIKFCVLYTAHTTMLLLRRRQYTCSQG